MLGSIILIAYRIFLPYIYIPYVIQCTDNILNFLGDYINRRNDELFISYIRTPKRPLKAEGIIRTFYLKSDKIIMQVYCYVFGAYAIFYLDRVSVLFDYLMFFYWGYRMAVRANAYSLDEASKRSKL